MRRPLIIYEENSLIKVLAEKQVRAMRKFEEYFVKTLGEFHN
jgi:hypothetical protein